MNADDLVKLVLSTADGLEFARAFEGLDEKQRAQLSSSAQKLNRHLFEGEPTSAVPEPLRSFLAARPGEVWLHGHSRENRKACLAVFAVGPLSAVKRWQVQPWNEDMPAFEKILRDRRPSWMDEWVEHALEVGGTISFPILHRWIKDGICRKPVTDGYYRLFANYHMRTGFYAVDEAYIPPLSEQLLQAPELLADIDSLFRVESDAFNTNPWLTKGAASHYETWTEALIKLSRAKHVERSHLLQLALDGLRLDIKQNQLSGYHKFYRAMEPTTAELTAHQSHYIALLCHPVSHVAKFAIDMLAKVDKAKTLERAPFLREIGTIFASDSKGNAIAALKILQEIIGQAKTPDNSALSAVVEAMRHADPEVQAKAIAILEPWAEKLSFVQVAELNDMSVLVAASNQPALKNLLARSDLDVSGTSLPQNGPRQPIEYRPVSFVGGCQNVLSADSVVEPITSVEKLIEAVLHAIEVVDSPDELECIIDAISRLADQRPADFDQRVAPLLHRVNKGQSGSNGLGGDRIGIGLAVLDLIATWASGKLYHTQNRPSEFSLGQDAFVPMARHLREISVRVAGCKSQSLVSAPTHRGGWIDPIVWVERLTDLEENTPRVGSMDFRLSMLRLAPDGRTKGLKHAEKLNGELGRLARFALGGGDLPRKSDQSNYATWITAARCREPATDWRLAFDSLALDDTWPDSLAPAVHEWTSSNTAAVYEQVHGKHPLLMFETRAEEPQGELKTRGPLASVLGKMGGTVKTQWEELPTAALCRRNVPRHSWMIDTQPTWRAQWLAYIWPQNLNSVHMSSAMRLAQRMDEGSSSESPNYGLLSSCFQKGRIWGEPGHLVLALSLVGKDADVCGLANDALIEGIEGRLFDPDIFASVMYRLCLGEWVKYNRLAENLLKISKVSQLHACAIDAALQAWLPRFDLAQRNAHYVLQVLVETQAISGAPLLASTRNALVSLKGKNKGTALAKQILA